MIGGSVQGLDNLLKKLADLERKAAKKLVRQAVTEGSGIVLKTVKPRVPQETGSLRKSFGRKTSTPRKTGVAVAVVGPRRKFKKDKKTGTRVLTAAGKRYAAARWPTKYFHLVEFGTKARKWKTRGGRSTGQVTPRPSLQPAVTSSATAVQSKMADVFKKGLGI